MAVKLSVLKRWAEKFVPMFEGDSEFKKAIEDAMVNVEDGEYEIALIQKGMIKESIKTKYVYSDEEKVFIKHLASFIKKYKLLLVDGEKIRITLDMYEEKNGMHKTRLTGVERYLTDAKATFYLNISADTVVRLLKNEGAKIEYLNMRDYTKFIKFSFDVE